MSKHIIWGAAMITVTVVSSISLALIKEPSSLWLWRDVLGLVN